MYVSKIEMDGFADRYGEAPLQGVVTFVSDQNARISVALDWYGAGCKVTMYRGLLSEALRQVSRMPEFRRSEPPRLAPGLFPEDIAA